MFNSKKSIIFAPTFKNGYKISKKNLYIQIKYTNLCTII